MSTVRIFTSAIKIPRVIGRTPDGKKLIGGPYTLTQFVGVGVVAMILWQTAFLWAAGGLVQNIGIFLMIVGATLYGLGKIPAGGRNPLSMLAGFGNAATAALVPSKVEGHVVRIRPPAPLRGDVVILPAPARPTVQPRPAVRPEIRVVRPAPARPAAALSLTALAAASVRK